MLLNFFLKDSKEKATYPRARKKEKPRRVGPTREPALLQKYPQRPQQLYQKLGSAQSSSTSCLFNNVLIHAGCVNTHCDPTTLSGGGGLRVWSQPSYNEKSVLSVKKKNHTHWVDFNDKKDKGVGGRWGSQSGVGGTALWFLNSPRSLLRQYYFP